MRSTCTTCGGHLPADSWALTICTEACFDSAADAIVLDLAVQYVAEAPPTVEAFA